MAIKRRDEVLCAIETWIKENLPLTTTWDHHNVLQVFIPEVGVEASKVAFLSHDGQTLWVNVRNEKTYEARQVSLGDPKSLDHITDFLRSVAGL